MLAPSCCLTVGGHFRLIVKWTCIKPLFSLGVLYRYWRHAPIHLASSLAYPGDPDREGAVVLICASDSGFMPRPPNRAKRLSMSLMGHSLPSHSAPVPTFVRCYSNSGQNVAARRNDAMCQSAASSVIKYHDSTQVLASLKVGITAIYIIEAIGLSD